MTTRFRALIVHPDETIGRELERMLKSLPSFYKANVVADIQTGLEQLLRDVPFDAVFLSGLFEAEELFGFMLAAKETPVGEDAVFVSIAANAAAEESEIFGIEIRIAEPFCKESLQNVVTLAQKTKLENSRARLIEAIRLMTSMVIAEIDSTARARAAGQSKRSVSAHIVEACKTFHDLSPDFLQTYYDLVIEAFMNVPPPGQKQSGKASADDHMRLALAQQFLRD